MLLPSGEDVLLPSTEASNGRNVHARINHNVTKSLSVVPTWVHTNNGTIPPSPIENTHLGSPTITHSQYLQVQINPDHNDLQIRNQGNPGDPSPN